MDFFCYLCLSYSCILQFSEFLDLKKNSFSRPISRQKIVATLLKPDPVDS